MRNVELDLLDTCIADIRSGQATVERCLEQHADHALALEPLLREVAGLTALPPVFMPAGAVDVLEQRLLGRAAKVKAAIPQKRRATGGSSWLCLSRGRRLWPAVLSLVLALVIASTWTVSASADSLPGETLYPLKLVTEKARLAVTFRDEARVQLHMSFADRRLDEMQSLVANDKAVKEDLLNALVAETRLAAEGIEKIGGDKKAAIGTKLLALTERQQAVLTSVRERAPEAAQRGLNRALEASRHGHERAMMALGVTPEPSPALLDTAVPGLHVSPTRKPTKTPKPAPTHQARPTRKRTKTPKPKGG
jgi:hypothetical protein